MLDISIALEIGSPHATAKTVNLSLMGILNNIGTDDYKFIIALSPLVKDDIKNYIYYLRDNYPWPVEIFEEDFYWADFLNKAIDKSKDAKYFVSIHDDSQLLTPNFYTKIEEALKKISEPVGWITFTDTDYLNGRYCTSTRPGFHRDFLFEDADNKRKMFQYHNLEDNWWTPYRFHSQAKHPVEYYTGLPYDLPSAPVKCHAPWTHFVLIELEQLKKIGNCQNWQTLAPLLTDEDWGLRALQEGLFNIWIPDIEYLHIKTLPWQQDGGSRCSDFIGQNKNRIGELFYRKWGFHSPPLKEELEFIKEQHKDNNIPWSIDRNSYDWDYI